MQRPGLARPQWGEKPGESTLGAGKSGGGGHRGVALPPRGRAPHMTLALRTHKPPHRHGQACPGHPRLLPGAPRTWMPGPSPRRSGFGRAGGTSPGMTTILGFPHGESGRGEEKPGPFGPGLRISHQTGLASGGRRIVLRGAGLDRLGGLVGDALGELDQLLGLGLVGLELLAGVAGPQLHRFSR